MEGSSISMALGSLMLERAEEERRFLSSSGRLRGWVLSSVFLRRVDDEWPGSVDWRTKALVDEDRDLEGSFLVGDGCAVEFLLGDLELLLVGDLVGEDASDE